MTSLVQDMYDGVKAMIAKEKELCAAANPKPSAEEVKEVKEVKEEAKPAEVEKVEEKRKPGPNILAGTHLKKPEDITGFIDFPDGTKSLLCKYLTKEVFDKYYGCKDKAGVSFEQMILSGAQNVDSGIGVYAGSQDSYSTFADLFD